MSVASPSLPREESRFPGPLLFPSLASILLFASLLKTLGVSLVAPALAAVLAVFLWLVFRHPLFCLGLILALIPLDPLALLLARFFGPSFLASDLVKAFDRIILLVPLLVLWLRNGIKLKTPDWFLLACCALAALRLAFGGSLIALVYDFDFIIAYAAGRVAILNLKQQEKWARRAVWIVAFLSVAGMIEVFVVGEGPRAALYLVAAEGSTEAGTLNPTYHAEGYEGLRESATMIGPLQFGTLCMVALIVWWVYRRSWLPGATIAAGLICTVSRSTWLGAALAIFLLIVAMRQKKRLLFYALPALALITIGISFVGLGDFLSSTVKGKEVSAEGHKESLVSGVTYVLTHPFGTGPGNAGTLALKNDTYAIWTENSYLTLAEAYGIPTAICFIGFLVSVLAVAWPQRTPLAYAVIGIVVGFSTVMMLIAGIYDVFSVACWIWFPVGLAVQSAASPAASFPAGHGLEAGTFGRTTLVDRG